MGLIALSDAVQVALIAASPAVLVALCTFIVAILTLRATRETHSIVNHRMDEFKLELQRAATLQVGVAREAGRKEGTDAANMRTDALAAAATVAIAVTSHPSPPGVE